MTTYDYPVPPAPPGKIVYNTFQIWNVGEEIVQNAAVAQQQHSDYVDHYIWPYLSIALRYIDGNENDNITADLLIKHIDRLGRLSPDHNGLSKNLGCYGWQIQMGNTLKLIADGINEQENKWVHTFSAGLLVPR